MEQRWSKALVIWMWSAWLSLSAMGQDKATCPKREFRAVWVTTVNNIDWPSRAGLSPKEQQAEFIALLDKAAAMNLNAVIVQVRPAADAFYHSRFEPWSQWLTGQQGQAPEPFYDPLKFMISQAHQRGLEFHAWLNPFRAMHHSRFVDICDQHISQRKPEWLLQYGRYVMLNPGIPDARMHVLRVVADIVQRYDIDGIHYDDYFYPYPDGSSKLNDWATFRKYKGAYNDIGDWRRYNVDEFIRMSARTIKQFKPWVKFGVSPYGTWRNQQSTPLGSNTLSGLASYDHLFADVRKWLEKGWVDYVAPQLYQNTRHHKSNFKILVEWWSDNAFGRHVYAGHAVYRIFSEDGGWSWRDKSEVPRQVRMVRETANGKGSVYFSWNGLLHNRGSISDSLRISKYPAKALPPLMPWFGQQPPRPPLAVRLANHEQGIRISWQPDPDNAPELQHGYAVYRFLKSDTTHDLSDPRNLKAVVYGDTLCVDKGVYDTAYFDYFVTAIAKSGHESTATPSFYQPTAESPPEAASEAQAKRREVVLFFLNMAKRNIERHLPDPESSP